MPFIINIHMDTDSFPRCLRSTVWVVPEITIFNIMAPQVRTCWPHFWVTILSLLNALILRGLLLGRCQMRNGNRLRNDRIPHALTPNIRNSDGQLVTKHLPNVRTAVE